LNAHALAKSYGQAHDAMRSIDGLQPAEALDELLNYLEARSGANLSDSSSVGFEETVERIWQVGQQQDGRLQLSLQATAAVHRALETVDFDSLTADVRATAFREFLSPEVRKGLGIFLTPDAVAQMVVRILGPGTGDTLLDPACGSGTFLLHATQDLVGSECGGPSLRGVDKSGRMVSIARLNLGIGEDSGFASAVQDSLSEAFDANLLQADSVKFIATNPPFGVEIDPQASWLSKYRVVQTLRATRSIPSEVLFLELGLRLLKPGGTMAIVLPRSVLTNRALAEARSMLGTLGYVYAAVDLPTETFASTGTMTRTCVLFVRRYASNDEPASLVRVRYCRVENVGFDMTGRHRAGSQLEVIPDRLQNAACDGAGDGLCVQLRAIPGEETLSLLHGLILESDHSALLGADSVPLEDLCELIASGTTPARSKYVESPGLFILKVGNLTGQGVSWLPRDRNFCTASKTPRLAHRGDILMTAAAHAAKYIAKKVDIVSDIPPEVGGRATWVAEAILLRPRADLISPFQLLAFLRLLSTQEAIRNMATGQTAHLRAGDLATLPVPTSVLSGSLDSLALVLEQETRLAEQVNRIGLKEVTLIAELDAPAT